MGSPSRTIEQFERRIGTDADHKYVASMPDVQARAMTVMWVRGASYGEISDEWECNIAVARLAVERTLSESLDDNENREMQRERLGLQLNSFMKAVMPRALDPKDKDQALFIRLGLLVAERTAKLWNLDAPTTIQLSMPSDDDLEKWVGTVLATQGAVIPVEGDPFSLEQNPDTGVFE